MKANVADRKEMVSGQRDRLRRKYYENMMTYHMLTYEADKESDRSQASPKESSHKLDPKSSCVLSSEVKPEEFSHMTDQEYREWLGRTFSQSYNQALQAMETIVERDRQNGQTAGFSDRH